MIPTLEQCSQLMVTHQMLDNIKAHSIVVARITEFIVSRFATKGVNIPLDLSVSAALLHDIGKTPCLNTNDFHADKGKEICQQHGYDEIAEIVAEHVILKNVFSNQPLTATEIVYYADKRVNHDQIVPLSERLSYIIDRYGQNNEKRCQVIINNFDHCLAIEKSIFSHLDCRSDDLAKEIENHHGKVRAFFNLLW